MSDAQEQPSGLETPDSQQHSPSGVKSMFGKVKNKAKKLRNKIKNKTSGGHGHGHDREAENAEPGSDDEDESGDQSPASAEQQEPKSEIPGGNTGYGNRGFSFDKLDSAPETSRPGAEFVHASSPGADAVEDRLGQLNLRGKVDKSASAAGNSPHVSFDQHPSVLDASSPGAGAVQDRLGQLNLGGKDDRSASPIGKFPHALPTAEKLPEEAPAAPVGQFNLGGKDDRSASPLGKFPHGVPTAEKLPEEAPPAPRVTSNLGSHERSLPSASPSDPLSTPAEDFKDGQPKDMFVPVQPTRDPVTRDLSATPTDLSKAPTEKKYDQHEDLPPPTDNLGKGVGDAVNVPEDRNEEGDSTLSGPAVTDQYDDEQGQKGYKDRAYDGLVSAKDTVLSAKDTVAGTAVGAVEGLGYKTSGAGSDKAYKDRAYDGLVSAKDTVLSAKDTVAGTAVGAAEGLGYKQSDKAYKDRAYDGLVSAKDTAISAKDTVAGSAVGAAEALGYKTSGAGGADNYPADRNEESDRSFVSGPAVTEKGYKDRAYDGLVTAKDTVAGSAVGAAEALGYKTSGAGGAENIHADRNEENDRSLVSGPAATEKGYKDRAYDGLVGTVAAPAAAVAGALGYKKSGAGGAENFPADRNAEGDRSFVSEPAPVDEQGEKGYKDRAYDAPVDARDTVAATTVGAAGAVDGYKTPAVGAVGALGNKISDDDGAPHTPATLAEDLPADRNDEGDRFPVSEPAVGEKGTKDRAYDGLVDTVAAPAAAVAGALGYKASGAGGAPVQASNDDRTRDIPSSLTEDVPTDQYRNVGEGQNKAYADHNKGAEEDELPVSAPATTGQYGNVQGEKGYKDHAYDGLTTAKDAAAGAAVAAAGALGYKAYDQGKEKSPEEVGPKSLEDEVPEEKQTADDAAAGAASKALTGYDCTKPGLEGMGLEGMDTQTEPEMQEPEMQEGENPSEPKSWLQLAREKIGGVASYSPSANAEGQLPADEQDIGLPADERNMPASDKELPSGGESGPTIASRATGAALGLRDTLASKLGYGASSPTAAATIEDGHGSQVEQPQAAEELNYSLSPIAREGELPEDEQDIGLPADEGIIPTSDKQLPSGGESGLRDSFASKPGYGASSPIAAAAATKDVYDTQLKQPQATDEQKYSPSASARDWQPPAVEQGIGLPADEVNIPASDDRLLSGGESESTTMPGLKDTPVWELGYGASSPIAAAVTDVGHDTQLKQPSPSASGELGYGESTMPGLKDTPVSKLGYGASSPIAAAVTDVGHDTQVKQPSPSASAREGQFPAVEQDIGFPAAGKLNYSPSASGRKGQFPPVEQDIGLPAAAADEQNYSPSASAREGQLPAVEQDIGLPADEENIPASDERLLPGGESEPTIASKATGAAWGLKDMLASKLGYGASSPTAAAVTDVGHDTQVMQPQAADKQYSPSASAREGQFPAVGQDIGLPAADKQSYSPSASARDIGLPAADKQSYSPSASARDIGLPADERNMAASDKELPSGGESGPTMASRATGAALGLKDTLASKLGYGPSSPTVAAATEDSHGTQLKQPQATDELTSSANQLPSPGAGTPTVASRAAGGVLSLKDTLASTLGYGASSPTSVASPTPGSVEDVAGKKELESPNSKSYVQKLQEAAAGGKDSLLGKLGYEPTGVPEKAGAEQQSIATLAKFGHGGQRSLPEDVDGDQHVYGEERTLPESVGGDQHGYGEQRTIPENVGDDKESSNPQQKSYFQKMQESAYGAKDIMAAKLGYNTDSGSPTGQSGGHGEQRTLPENVGGDQQVYGEERTLPESTGGDQHGYGEQRTIPENVGDDKESSNPQKSYFQKMQEGAYGAKDIMATKLGYNTDSGSPTGESGGSSTGKSGVTDHKQNVARFDPGEGDQALGQIITDNVSYGVASVRDTLMSPFSSPKPPTTTSSPSDTS